MLHKIGIVLLVVPSTVIMIGFAVANRQSVTISFDPFSSTDPAYAATLPLFMIIFVSLILGVLIGGLATWLRQRTWRRATRRLDNEVHVLRQELETVRRFANEKSAPTSARQPAILPPNS